MFISSLKCDRIFGATLLPFAVYLVSCLLFTKLPEFFEELNFVSSNAENASINSGNKAL